MTAMASHASVQRAQPDELGPTLTEIYEARRRIMGVARRTPLERSLWLSEQVGHDVYLKLECWQRTRSFKMRGAYNAVAALAPAQRARGLVTASAGNHGQAVALAAREVGTQATIFVPSDAPETTKARIKSFGARLNQEYPTYDDAQVADSAIPATIRELYNRDGVIAEDAAGTPVAAITESVLKLDGPAVVVITGGNIDAERYAAILSGE
ncbi:MAG: threonine ammonia-lyase [Gemmatimonadota bacterium]